MTDLRYCNRCLYPQTKPELHFNEDGLCSACQAYDARLHIDWRAREEQFVQLVNETWRALRYGGQPWVIVPVSGGKDSTAQVVKCKELGFRVLAVNARTDMLSDLGRRNLDNIGRLTDVVEFCPNDATRRQIMRLALAEVGDWSWPEHVLIHTIPFQASVKFRIPVIVYGELAQNEYGAGPQGSEENMRMTRRWVEEFAGFLGLRVDDVRDLLDLNDDDMGMYRFPYAQDLKDCGVTAVWLGQYFPWDGYENFLVAQKHGFTPYHEEHVEGSLYNYENLDNYATGPRDYFRFVKYGYGRATDIASNHIRRGRLKRDEAIRLIKDRDGAFPATYLGKPISEILDPLELTVEQFVDYADRFTNKSLFELRLNELRPQPLFQIR